MSALAILLASIPFPDRTTLLQECLHPLLIAVLRRSEFLCWHRRPQSSGRLALIHGRFGSHQYLNVDGCLRSSIELARKLNTQLTDADILRRFKGLASD